MQATEVMVFVALVLALVPLQKFPFAFKIIQWKCPLQNENGLALLKIKLKACIVLPIIQNPDHQSLVNKEKLTRAEF